MEVCILLNTLKINQKQLLGLLEGQYCKLFLKETILVIMDLAHKVTDFYNSTGIVIWSQCSNAVWFDWCLLNTGLVIYLKIFSFILLLF